MNKRAIALSGLALLLSVGTSGAQSLPGCNGTWRQSTTSFGAPQMECVPNQAPTAPPEELLYGREMSAWDRLVLNAQQLVHERTSAMNAKIESLGGFGPLSGAVNSPENPLSNIKPPSGYEDPFDPKADQVDTSKSAEWKRLNSQPGYNPFTGQVEKKAFYGEGGDSYTLQPPAPSSEADALPPPGSLERQGNCTFASPSCWGGR